ncbi:glycosyl transferase [Tianweitania populi]|uniref:Glycosyl transferase n=2 Tax=Tianweitania populi TaxID=1607949 RepID=A0A8J3GM50_9HYPH|nr:glycosyl transferase [Tianweitania populi]
MRSGELGRKLDQSVGTVIAPMIGAMRRKAPMPRNPRRIVVIEPTAIGDTLIGSGCILALTKRFPRATVIVAHGPSNAAAVEILLAPVEMAQISFTNPLKAGMKLRSLAPDIVVDLCPWPYATALAARMTGAWTAGFVPQGSRRGSLYDLAVPHHIDRHESRNLWAMADALGAGPVSGMAIKRHRALLEADLDPRGLVLCHIAAGGSRAAAKAWPMHHWRKLIHALVQRGYRVGLTGTSKDQRVVDDLIQRVALPNERVTNLCGKLSLSLLAELLAEVDMLISVDTGVLHLSAAVNGRSIGLHGPTRAARWGSSSPHAIGLDAPHPYAGYINYGFEQHSSAMQIMATLRPSQVLTVMDGLAPSLQAG